MRLLIFLLILIMHNTYASESIRLLSTTSTRDSGFLDHIIPFFEKKYKIRVLPSALGTGQALVSAKNCDGDILLTHAPELEKEFIKDGYGTDRTPIMYNDFVVIGPNNDPLGLDKHNNVIDVFKKIKDKKVKFISRGDNSGTNFSELSVWNRADINPNLGKGIWYLESGQGMGATLNITVGMNAYTYSDRATWIRYQNKQKHEILFEGDDLLLNEYSIILLNNENCPTIKQRSAILFYKWITSQYTQEIINKYRINGQQVFFSNRMLGKN